MCCDPFPLDPEPSFDANAYLAERFKHDVCLDCGGDADAHTVSLDTYGEPRVRCNADDEDDRLVVRAHNRRWMLGYLGVTGREIDTLATMYRRGSITVGMRQAGEAFRVHFRTAQLDPLHATDLTPRADQRLYLFPPSTRGSQIDAARDVVWRALLAVGGIGSPAGSALWHIVGWERPIKEFALQQGWSGHLISQETASGILIAALGALEQHLRVDQP